MRTLAALALVACLAVAAQASWTDWDSWMAVAKKLEAEARAARDALFVSDPDMGRDVCDIVRSKGFPCERHYATTADGYILGLVRLPHGRNGAASTRGPVFLQHGVLDSCFSWVLNDASQSLGYVLADAGFDVWLGNSRGTLHSQNHTMLAPSSEDFWDFTWDEMARYDVLANLQLIIKTTGALNVRVVGHSQGTTQVFAGLLVEPKLQKLVRSFVALAPVASLAHNTLPKISTDVCYLPETALYLALGKKGFLDLPHALRVVMAHAITDMPTIATDILKWAVGASPHKWNTTRLSVEMYFTPGPTSAKNMVHWCQLVKSGKFAAHDFGTVGNLLHYGSIGPMVYDLTKMPKVPMLLMSGVTDTLAAPEDVQYLVSSIPLTPEWAAIPDYDHLDFTWAIDANKVIFPKILSFFA